MAPRIGQRLAHVAVALLVGASLATCGEDKSTTQSSTATTATPAQLATVLITAADLGARWTVLETNVATTTTTTASTGSAVAPTTSSTEPSQLCPAAASVAPNFERTTNGPQASVALTGPTATANRPVGISEHLWSLADAAALLGEAKAAVAACTGQHWTSSDGEQMTLNPLTGLPALGDETVTLELRVGEPTHTGDVEWWVPIAVVRVGTTVAMVIGTDIHDAGGTATLTTADLTTAMQAAVRRIATLA